MFSPSAGRTPAGGDHPLGPRLVYLPGGRWACALVAAGCIAVLLLAWTIGPDGHGLGPQTQRIFPPCGFSRMTGYPCPTCGMTRAFGRTVHGDWIGAVRIQPVGWLLCVGVMAVCGLALGGVLTGRSWRVNWYRVSLWRWGLALAGLFAGGWAYTIIVGLLDGSLPAA